MSHKIRIAYFESCLQKDGKYYDEVNPAEMASKISKETTSIQMGFGEKVGQCINAGFSFFFGFFFAFFFGAYFTLILLAGFPILACVFVGFALALDKGQLE